MTRKSTLLAALFAAAGLALFGVATLSAQTTVAKLEAETAVLRDLVADGFGAKSDPSPMSGSEGGPGSRVNA